MRVLELSQRYAPAVGGVESTLEDLVDGLRSAGVETEVLTTDLLRDRPFARLRPPYPEFPYPVRRYRAVRPAPLPLGLGIASPGRALAAIGTPADVVHAHAFGYAPTWTGAWVRSARGIPLVITPHADPGRGLAFSRLYHRCVARSTLRHADRIVVQSDTERRFLVGLGVDAGRTEEIPTGIALARYPPRPAVRRDGPVRLLYVGRLDLAQKGLLDLVEAVARVPSSTPVELELLGEDWGARAPVEALAARRGLVPRLRIRLSPSREEVRAAYYRSDLLVLPSRFESFPRVLLEAMAAGLPAIATDVGGVRELTHDGATAALVPPGEPAALADAIAALARDGARRNDLGRAARARAEWFDWPRWVPRYLELFGELARRGRRPGAA